MTQRPDGRVIIDVDANLEKFNTKLKSLTGTAVKGLAAMGAAAGAAIGASIKVGKEFESAFAGVRKTVEATEEEFKQLEKSILDMSTQIPATAAEIAGIAEAAGQLGIQNKNIIEFTRVMADLGVATNMSGDAAATTLARFANITQMAQEDFDRLGSSIVALGNNLATTESEIADMALNIAGAATQVGFTEAQILALSGALSSVGIEAQAGGTAVSTLIINMKKATIEGGDDLKDFAKAANMTADEFKKAFEEDAAGAVQKFIEGLATAEERGSNAFQLLEEAGINEARMTRAMLSLSGASDVLANAFEISNKAWEENNALSKEAAERYETTDSKLQILQNSLALTGITIFDKFKAPLKDALNVGIEGFDDLNKQLSQGELGVKVDKISQSFTRLVGTLLDGAVKAIPIFIDGLEWLIDNGDKVIAVLTGISAGSVTFKTVKGIESLTKTFKASSIGAALLAKEITVLGAAQKALSLVMSPALGIGLAIGAVTALTVGYVLLTNKVDEATASAQENIKRAKESKQVYDELTESAQRNYETSILEISAAAKYSDEISGMIDKNGNLTGTKEELETAIHRLNGALGDSIYWYDQETGKIMDNKGAVDDLKQSVKDLIVVKKGQAWLDANMDKYINSLQEVNKITDDNIKLQKDLNEIESKYGKESLDKVDEFKKKWEDANLPIEALYYSFQSLAGQGVIDWEDVDAFFNIAKAQEFNNELGNTHTEFINLHDAMMDAIEGNDIGVINQILAGGDPNALKNTFSNVDDLITKIQDVETNVVTAQQTSAKGNFIDENKLEEDKNNLAVLKQTLLETFGLNYDEIKTSGAETISEYINSLMVKGEELPPQLQALFTESFESVKGPVVVTSEDIGGTTGEALSNKLGDTLGLNLPREGKEAMDLLGSSIDGWISSYVPKTIYIPIAPKIDPSLSGYGYQPPGATYDGASGSSIIPDFSGIMDRTRNVISKMTSRIGTVVLGSKDGQVVENNKNIVINQNNNFNVPVEKPSEASRKLERTTKDLAKVL